MMALTANNQRVNEMMKRVSIIGLGWLGLPLARFLAEKGYEVIGSKTTFEGVQEIRQQGINSRLLNITPELGPEFDNVSALFRTDVLIITLPVSTGGDGKFGYAGRIQKIADLAQYFQVKQVVFLSSTSVYSAKGGHYSESAPTEPDSENGKILLSVEKTLRQSAIPSVAILRLAGLVGPKRHPGYFLAGKKQCKGAEQPVNLVHQQDVVSAIHLLLQHPKARILYNLCAPEHPSKREFYPHMAVLLGLEPPEFVESVQNEQLRMIDGQHICDELGFVYSYPNPLQMTFRQT